MKALLLKYWEQVRSSFWFLPSIMGTAAVALAFSTVALDETVTERWLKSLGWVYSGGAEGASAVLQTIAGSMITIAGVVFSMTLVALSLASSQFGPRLLRNFMRDSINQVVLGTFVATFLYCLLVLRTIRYTEERVFVPHLSVTLGVVFALVSLWVLIYFIHHVSISIHADEIVARVGDDLIDGIERLFPHRLGDAGSSHESASGDPPPPEAFEREARAIPAAGDGYLQIVDTDALVALATETDTVLRIERRPGRYLVMGSPLAMVWPGNRVTGEYVKRVNALFVRGTQRTPAQDVEFSIHQLVEIAVRAMSPGINDPFTAMACVDRLGSGLSRLARREMPSRHRLDARRQLRLTAPAVTFPELVDAAFHQIRQYSRTSAAVTIRLLDTIALVAGAVMREPDRVSLLQHADMIIRGAREALPEAEDRRVAEARHEIARRALHLSL